MFFRFSCKEQYFFRFTLKEGKNYRIFSTAQLHNNLLEFEGAFFCSFLLGKVKKKQQQGLTLNQRKNIF